ncbi:MAG: WecB/TagA/CpsF family glycosyltransferase [bacterium]
MGLEDFFELCKRWLKSNKFNHVVTLNPEMIMLAERDNIFRSAVRAAEIRVPDGAGLVWARWYLRSGYWPLLPSLLTFLWQKVERVTGVDAVMILSRLCQRMGKSIYLLGGTSQQRQETANKLKRRFPELAVTAGSQSVKEFQPAVLLVAYGAPKQTVWIEEQRKNLPSVRIAMGVGGAFAMISEDLPRAPRWLRTLNIEWLWRLYLEPGRWPRIWQATVRFPLLMRKQKKLLL